MGALGKADMVQALSKQYRLPRHVTKRLVDAFFDEMIACLASGEPLKMSGLGNFILLDKPARPGRNPRTGQYAEIAARRVVTFKPSAQLKARLVD